MRKLILLTLLPFSAMAQPVMEYQKDGYTIRLESGPCLAPVAALVHDDHRTVAKAGTVTHGDTTLRLCWAILTPGIVTLIDEYARNGGLPVNEFRPTRSPLPPNPKRGT